MNEILVEKKNILIQILTSLQDTWDMAGSLIELINHTEANEVFIHDLFNIIEKGLKNIRNTRDSQQVEKALSTLQKIKAIEIAERNDEIAQCESLQKTLSEFTLI